MSYKIEGTLGEISMKFSLNAVVAKIIPSGEYTREISGKRKMLAIDDANENVILLDVGKEFTIPQAMWSEFSALIVAAKVSKLKVVLLCDEKGSVESLSVV